MQAERNHPTTHSVWPHLLNIGLPLPTSQKPHPFPFYFPTFPVPFSLFSSPPYSLPFPSLPLREGLGSCDIERLKKKKGKKERLLPRPTMASSSDHHHGERPKPDEDEHQPKPNSPPDGNHNSASPPPPPPSAGHQDATTPNNYHHQPHPGYPPPVMGYPPPYPSPHNINGGYPYGAPPPPGGYYPPNDPHYYRSQAPPRTSSGFARGIIAGLIFLVAASCTITVITYVVLHPQTPEFHVTAFSVNNFNISNSVLMGRWDANVTVDNKNEKLEAYFERIQSYVYYQDPRSYLSWSTEPAFSLEAKTSGVMNVKMSMIDGEQPTSSELEEMNEERRNGTVIFGLGFGLVGTFKSGWWKSHFAMRVYCHDLAVEFAGASGTGILRDPNPRQCTVYF